MWQSKRGFHTFTLLTPVATLRFPPDQGPAAPSGQVSQAHPQNRLPVSTVLPQTKKAHTVFHTSTPHLLRRYNLHQVGVLQRLLKIEALLDGDCRQAHGSAAQQTKAAQRAWEVLTMQGAWGDRTCNVRCVCRLQFKFLKVFACGGLRRRSCAGGMLRLQCYIQLVRTFLTLLTPTCTPLHPPRRAICASSTSLNDTCTLGPHVQVQRSPACQTAADRLITPLHSPRRVICASSTSPKEACTHRCRAICAPPDF